MRSKRLVIAMTSAAVLIGGFGLPARAGEAARPAPTFVASSAPLPQPLMTGSWKESDPGARARLSFAGTNAASLSTTTYEAHWQSKPFPLPERLSLVMTAVPSGYLARPTEGKDTYFLAARVRMVNQPWSKWFEIKGTMPKAPFAGVIFGDAGVYAVRLPGVKRGTKMVVEVRLRGSMAEAVTTIDSALDVRAGLDAGAPV